MKAIALLNIVSENLYNRNTAKAFLYLNDFETFADSIDVDATLYQAIEDTYSSVGVYYFKIGKYKDAKSKIKKGLEYFPGSYKLKSRLRALED